MTTPEVESPLDGPHLFHPKVRRRVIVFVVAIGVFSLTAFSPWHSDERVRRAAGIVLATLILWISEVAPLGVTALAIPVAATLAGVMGWSDAVAAWGDPIIFLFLGAFLLARALEKHGVLESWAQGAWSQRLTMGSEAGLVLVILLASGLISTMQNNTAVTAMLLPLVLRLGRTSRMPAIALLALSYGATFGGMATPVGTAPNFIGYAAMKKLDASVSFISWLRVGVPVWLGTTVIGWTVLEAARRLAGDATGDGTKPQVASATRPWRVGNLWHTSPVENRCHMAQRWAIGAFAVTAGIWLASGLVISVTDPQSALHLGVKKYLPESLVPIALAWVLFMVRTGRNGHTVLDRRDFQALDWDTLFLIAGGLCLGKMLESSGAASALAAAVGTMQWSPIMLMLSLAVVTVLLSELTSNTATASLMVPIAGSLAESLGLSGVQAVWLVALSASLGFALPISTPPNAIVYGTGLVPLRHMIRVGLLVDILSVIWVVACVYWWG